MDAIKNKVSGGSGKSNSGGSGNNNGGSGGGSSGMATKGLHALDNSKGGDKLNDQQEHKAGDAIGSQIDKRI
ncbi:hypothetical protein GGR56DRAFT_678811 [Xylariaceae sp. FL0804]|nr:hypothetical protein GGR56DRAFT_678811 [Xylariaceae sp. FL0804]